MIKTWSSNQSVIGLSSGEAEYYAFVKWASQGIGIKNIMEDLGVEVVQKIQLLSDASAAIGIASRRVSGKVRHIEVHQLWLQDRVLGGSIEVRQLWLQDRVLSGSVEVTKIGTGSNLADALTTNVEAEVLGKHMKGLGVWIESGRHVLMPAVAEQTQECTYDPDEEEG